MHACALCSPADEELLWHDDFCRVIWVDDPHYPGFCRVILHTHVREMSDLAAADQTRLMQVVFSVESAVRATLQPDKINLASLGNVVPHVHWHVIPRWMEDVNFPDAIWAPPRRADAAPGPLASANAEAIRSALRQQLAARLG